MRREVKVIWRDCWEIAVLSQIKLILRTWYYAGTELVTSWRNGLPRHRLHTKPVNVVGNFDQHALTGLCNTICSKRFAKGQLQLPCVVIKHSPTNRRPTSRLIQPVRAADQHAIHTFTHYSTGIPARCPSALSPQAPISQTLCTCPQFAECAGTQYVHFLRLLSLASPLNNSSLRGLGRLKATK